MQGMSRSIPGGLSPRTSIGDGDGAGSGWRMLGLGLGLGRRATPGSIGEGAARPLIPHHTLREPR